MGVSDWVVLARLVRPQGRKGELLADLLTDFPARFQERRKVFLQASHPKTTISTPIEPRPVEIENHWLHKGRVVLKFSGIDSINDAEQLRGMDVVIPSPERTPLAEDEVYIDDLLDCVVYDESSSDGGANQEGKGKLIEVGRIIDVDMEATAGALLVVKRPNGDEVLIPFVKAYLPDVDVAAKQIKMKLPEGLLEVNAPLSAGERRALDEERRAPGSEAASAPLDPARTEE